MTPCNEGHLQFLGKPCPTCLRQSILQRHIVESKKFRTRIRMAPKHALRRVQKSFNRTHTSPFQVLLAQAQPPVQITRTTTPRVPAIPLSVITRNALSLEILWILGMGTALWWLK